MLSAKDSGPMAIAADPAIHAEAKRVWPALRELAIAPAGEAGVMRPVAKRFALFPQPERTEPEWRAWWSAYVDALSDLPEAAIELALQAYVREPDAEFLPKPGRIRDLARQARTPAAIAAERCATAAAYTPPVGIGREHALEPERRRPTPEERAEAVRLAAEFCEQVEARRPKPVDPIRFRAKTDDRGITAEMRELLARQAGAS